jgi:hypothetical protein
MAKKGTKKSSRRSSAMAAPLMLPMSMPDDSSSDSSSRYIWGAVLLVIVAIAVVVATQPGPFGLGTTTSAPTTQAAGLLAGLGGGMGAGTIVGIIVAIIVVLGLAGAFGVFGKKKYAARAAAYAAEDVDRAGQKVWTMRGRKQYYGPERQRPNFDAMEE